MATFKDICEQDTLYVCDNCQETFKAREVKLVEASFNVSILTPPSPVIVVNKEGVIQGGVSKFKEGDRTLACPKCNHTHLFGFDKVGG